MDPSQIEAQFEHQQMVSQKIIDSVEDLCQVGIEQLGVRRIETYISALNEDWQEFANNHRILISSVAELAINLRVEIKGHSHFTHNLFQSTRRAFLNSHEKITKLLDSASHSMPTAESATNSGTIPSSSFTTHRLLCLDLPKFDGNQTEWLTFRDLFSSMVISNRSLSTVEKLHYLRTCLIGPVAQLLKHTALIGDSFEKAWNDIVSYYNNTRILVDSALHSLFSIKLLQKESASSLEELYTTVQQNIRSLEMSGQPVQHWDSFLIYLVTRCLDQNSSRAWELDLGSSTDYPTWQQLVNFIINRMRSLQAVERAKPSGSTSTASAQCKSHIVQQSIHSAAVKKCSICEKDYLVFSCPEYSSKSRDRKIELIKQKSLCYNCLGHHRVNSCPSPKRCLKCGSKHHTSIHILRTNSLPSPPCIYNLHLSQI